MSIDKFDLNANTEQVEEVKKEPLKLHLDFSSDEEKVKPKPEVNQEQKVFKLKTKKKVVH